jgi:hypothetical protein
MGWVGETGGGKISKSGPRCRRHQVVRMFGMLGWMMLIGGALLIIGGALLIVFSLAFPMEAMEEAVEILLIGVGAILLGSLFLRLDEIATLKTSRRGK